MLWLEQIRHQLAIVQFVEKVMVTTTHAWVRTFNFSLSYIAKCIRNNLKWKCFFFLIKVTRGIHWCLQYLTEVWPHTIKLVSYHMALIVDQKVMLFIRRFLNLLNGSNRTCNGKIPFKMSYNWNTLWKCQWVNFEMKSNYENLILIKRKTTI